MFESTGNAWPLGEDLWNYKAEGTLPVAHDKRFSMWGFTSPVRFAATLSNLSPFHSIVILGLYRVQNLSRGFISNSTNIKGQCDILLSAQCIVGLSAPICHSRPDRESTILSFILRVIMLNYSFRMLLRPPL